MYPSKCTFYFFLAPLFALLEKNFGKFRAHVQCLFAGLFARHMQQADTTYSYGTLTDIYKVGAKLLTPWVQHELNHPERGRKISKKAAAAKKASPNTWVWCLFVCDVSVCLWARAQPFSKRRPKMSITKPLPCALQAKSEAASVLAQLRADNSNLRQQVRISRIVFVNIISPMHC